MVDARDSAQILQLDGGSACETWAADVNGDGIYDADDLIVLQGIVETTRHRSLRALSGGDGRRGFRPGDRGG